MTNTIKILGSSGGKTDSANPTSIQLTNETVIDAGNLLSSLGEKASLINHIFLTHLHFDHIIDLPLLIDTLFEQREKPLNVYGRKEAIEQIKKHIFNWEIWPDFSEIPLLSTKNNSVNFIEIEFYEDIIINDCTLKAIPNNHTDSSCGYVITKDGNATLFTSDTYCCQSIWDEVNNNPLINSVIIDISFPSRLDELAKQSKHLTPRLLQKELQSLKKDDITIFINHLKPAYINEILQELEELDQIAYNIIVLKDNDTINLSNNNIFHANPSNYYLELLNDIGHSLSTEKDIDCLMEKILSGTKKMLNADAGTFYLMSDDEKSLQFVSVQTDSLNIKLGGKSNPIPWPNLQLYNEDGSKNKINIAVKCAVDDKLINIPDVYDDKEFSFDGPKSFDNATGYRTTSMLVAPMKNHENEVIGVLQLINKKNEFGEIIEFTPNDEGLILSLSSQAAVTVSNTKLMDDLNKLIKSFMYSIADAIGEKSKYTVGHINRVAELTVMMAEEINKDNEGLFKDKYFNADELDALDMAAWMHDVGKITTPEYIVDKATKLETIYDRIATVESKFEILKRDLEISYLKKLSNAQDEDTKLLLQENYTKQLHTIIDDFKFLKQINIGGEFMPDDYLQRVHNIANQQISINGEKVNILTENEVQNLTIRKGTLTEKERLIINNHAKVSYDMLNSLQFPKKLQDVPKIAASHHEKICGGGYPFGLKGDQISLESRILAIADIFEALTAHDRPYKSPNTLNQSMKILFFMAKDGELDPTLVKFFVEKNLHIEYAKNNLMESQIDKVTVNFNRL